MSAEIEEHISAAETFYWPVILGQSSRLRVAPSYGGSTRRR